MENIIIVLLILGFFLFCGIIVFLLDRWLGSAAEQLTGQNIDLNYERINQ